MTDSARSGFDGSRIVVYAGKGFLEYATRVVLTLDYAGFGSHTSLLDGGSAAWVKEGRPVTDVVPPKRASALAALQLKPIIVDADYVEGAHREAWCFDRRRSGTGFL